MKHRVFLPVVLVVLGIYFLMDNLGLIHFSLKEILSVWWPVVLIGVGVSLFMTPNRIKDRLKDTPDDKIQ